MILMLLIIAEILIHKFDTELIKSEVVQSHHPNFLKKAIKVYQALLISSLKFSAI